MKIVRIDGIRINKKTEREGEMETEAETVKKKGIMEEEKIKLWRKKNDKKVNNWGMG